MARGAKRKEMKKGIKIYCIPASRANINMYLTHTNTAKYLTHTVAKNEMVRKN